MNKTQHNHPIPGWRTVTDGEEQRLYRDGDDDHAVTVSAEGEHTSFVLRRGDVGALLALRELLTGVLFELTIQTEVAE